jgi:hypothetical protein
LQALFPRNLIHDPHHTLDGMLVLRCYFCNTFQTPIEYDMKIHLQDRHRTELVTHLLLRGKGFDMKYRADKQNTILFITIIYSHQDPYTIEREPDLRKEQEEYFRRIR